MTTEQAGLFDQAHTEARRTDPATSHAAAKRVFRRESKIHRLLMQYGTHFQGLTDEEAAHHAGITTGCPWKRCSELREVGLIVPTGETRESATGAEQRVCEITFSGKRMLGLIAAGK